MKKSNLIKIIYAGAVLGCFLLGTIGYLMASETWYDATYYSAQMFLMNYTAPVNGNIVIYIARVLCPIMTAASILALVRNVFKTMSDSIASGFQDATALYYDTEQMKKIGKNFKLPIYMENKINKKAKNHVLMFSDDMDNLDFYEDLKGSIPAGSRVYIKVSDVDSKLLKHSDVYFYNINEIIARTYWRERNLKNYLVEDKMNIKIAILGFGALGQDILNYGLMNNIYSLNQSIQYHIWGDSVLYRSLLGDFDKMNGDQIIYHDEDWRADIQSLKDFDRIIVAQEPSTELIQALLYLTSDAEIDFYNPEGINLRSIYEGGKLIPFGVLEEILTEDNIKSDKMYRAAKEVNYNYMVHHPDGETYSWSQPDVEEVMEALWTGLSSFKKGSNASSADYHYVRLLVMDAFGMDEEVLSAEQLEMLAEMEHIRWSRYHYVHHWSYGGEELSEEERKAKRLHLLLVPYASLPREEKDKDIEVVQELLMGRE